MEENREFNIGDNVASAIAEELAMSTTSARVILITGANKGIGFEVARQLGKAGHRILLGARDLARGPEAAATLNADVFTSVDDTAS